MWFCCTLVINFQGDFVWQWVWLPSMMFHLLTTVWCDVVWLIVYLSAIRWFHKCLVWQHQYTVSLYVTDHVILCNLINKWPVNVTNSLLFNSVYYSKNQYFHKTPNPKYSTLACNSALAVCGLESCSILRRGVLLLLF